MEIEKIFYEQITDWLAENENNSIIIIANEITDDGNAKIFATVQGNEKPLITSIAQTINNNKGINKVLSDAMALRDYVNEKRRKTN
jgi:vacuolar-type H+-ATPase subunit F/Vma7